MVWSCPKCERELRLAENTWMCDNGHAYDRAKEGYVNLLPSGKKLAGTVGDSRAMLQARREFFAAGHYAPLLERLAGLVAGLNPRTVADIGCGEGYYLDGIAQAVSDATCLGTDIARDAVRLAAKAYPQALFAAADTYGRLPFHEHQVDVLINVFAPRNPAEFSRVTDPSGTLIVVIPAPEHLAELRAREGLIGLQPDKLQAVVTGLERYFKLRTVENLGYPLDLTAAAVASLISMTPNARFQAAGEPTYEPIGTQAAFDLLVFDRLA